MCAGTRGADPDLWALLAVTPQSQLTSPASLHSRPSASLGPSGLRRSGPLPPRPGSPPHPPRHSSLEARATPKRLSSWAFPPHSAPHPPEELISGPRPAGQHRAPGTCTGVSLKDGPVHGAGQGPPRRLSPASFTRGGPRMLLWLWCGRAAGLREPGCGRAGLRRVGTEKAQLCLAVCPACHPSRWPRVHRTRPRESRPPCEGVCKTQGKHNRNHRSGGLLQKITRMSNFSALPNY